MYKKLNSTGTLIQRTTMSLNILLMPLDTRGVLREHVTCQSHGPMPKPRYAPERRKVVPIDTGLPPASITRNQKRPAQDWRECAYRLAIRQTGVELHLSCAEISGIEVLNNEVASARLAPRASNPVKRPRYAVPIPIDRPFRV